MVSVDSGYKSLVDYVKELVLIDPELAKYRIADVYWHEWVTMAGNRYEGVILDFDDEDMIVFCTDGETRAVTNPNYM